MIYWLGIRGYVVTTRVAATVKRSGAGQSFFSSNVIEETILLLQKAMENDKIYLNPNLNLSLMARHTGIAPKTISWVLNQHLKRALMNLSTTTG
jgi:hypothetical protein